MAAKQKAAQPKAHDPNHVVVEVRVNQDPGYNVVNKRSDGQWQDDRDRRWTSPQSRKQFAASEMRSGFGFDLTQQAEIGTITETPSDTKEALEETRLWYRKSFFVQEITRLKFALYNYGFKIKPVSKKDRDAFKAWWKERGPQVKRFIKETWLDKLVMNNAVAFWRKINSRGKPEPKIITLPPERCRYTDALGLEKLSVRLGWHEDDFKVSQTTSDKTNFFLPADVVKKYSKGGFLPLLPEQGDYFKVYKEERIGWGFAWPTMQALFHTFAQDESMEVADRLWAFVARRVEVRHKLGHEIRQGPLAGQSRHFITKERATAVLQFYEGRTGFVENVCNFDQGIEFPFPDNARFDKEKYASIWERMALWAGPVGLFLHALHVGRGNIPYLMEAAQAEAEEAREGLIDYMIDVINEVLRPNFEIKIQWSNRIFQDRRMQFEMLKFLMTSGPLSGRTALEEAGFDPEEEREFKQEEYDLAKDEKTKGQILPPWDPSHGGIPGQGDLGGRPKGTTDGAPRVGKE